METEKKIPNYIYEDLLFKRRLERSLNGELERLYNLLCEQVRLLRARETMMADMHAAVEQRWKDEEQSTLIDSAEHTERRSTPNGPRWRTTKTKRTDALRGQKRGELPQNLPR